MTTLAGTTWRAAVVGRWTARIVGTLMALFFLAFLVGEGPPPIFRLGWRESLTFVGMAGLFCGLLLAWKWERVGGLVTLAAFVLLVAADRRLSTTAILLIPTATAAVHVLCGWRIASGPPATGPAWKVPGVVLSTAGILVAVFALLCVNEMFGDPPLMTPALRPAADMVGGWQGEFFYLRATVKVEFLIAADGEVSGTIGETPITGGRIRNNRSWFGGLMHWRMPYEIRGRGFRAGTDFREGRMRVYIRYPGSQRQWGRNPSVSEGHFFARLRRS